jgi:hypothetical protein
MTGRFERADAYLQADVAAVRVIATAIRELRPTPRRPTVVKALRWWVPLTLAIVMAACSGGGGGGKRGDTYAKGTDVQGQCCENLTGAERDRCLSEIVRVDDPGAAKTSTNQATYACVVEHFVCNPQTGRSTPVSAQAQYDCIEDQAR